MKPMIIIKQEFEWYFKNGYITTRDGNACVRQGENFLVTASGVRKDDILSDEYVILDQDGELLESPSGGRSSIEAMAHIDALQLTQKQASVHVHSPNTVALFELFSKSKFEAVYSQVLMNKWPELCRYTELGHTVPFFEPGSEKLHEEIARSFVLDTEVAVRMADIVVMQRHGVLAVGNDLGQCREHILRLEHTSSILLKIITASGGNLETIL